MTTQEIEEVGKYLFRATEEIIDFDSEDPWGRVEGTLRDTMLSEECLPAMQRIHDMCDGLIWSMNFEADRAKANDECYAIVEDEKGRVRLALIAVASTFAMRMFALGAQAQKTASEVSKLEALLGGD